MKSAVADLATFRNALREIKAQVEQAGVASPGIEPPLARGPDESHVSPMSGGLATYRLEQAEKRAEAADARMARIEGGINDIKVTLAGLPTKDSLRNYLLASLAVGLAIMGIVIGGIIGGLDWIKIH